MPESQSWRRCFGVCFVLTMPRSSRNHPTEQLRKTVGVIVVVCAVFSLTVSEANCYNKKWWSYILALYLEPTYYILHTTYIHIINNNNNTVTLLVVF